MQWLRQFIAKNPAKVFREGPEPITMGIKEHDMSWAVSVFENGKLYQRIQYKDKNKALKHVEALKKLSMAVDATVWMEEISDDE